MKQSVRFATWNIKDGGIYPEGSEDRCPGQTEVLRRLECDVLALQELTGWHLGEWHRLYALADALGMVALPPVTSRAVPGGINHQALLYRPEIVKVLSYTPDRGREVFHHGLAKARFLIQDTEILVLATHLSWTDGPTRLAESRWLTDYAGEFFGQSHAAVLLGDLNTIDPDDTEPDWNDVPVNLQSRYRRVLDDGTFGTSDRDAAHVLLNSGWVEPHRVLGKSKSPTVGHWYENEPTRLRLDYTLITEPLSPCVEGAWTLNEEDAGRFSDHLPTGVDLNLAKAKAPA